MNTLTAAVASLALSGTLLSAAPPAQTSSLPEELHECARAVARCDGTLAVPLDWRNPSSERIEVAFAWIPATEHATGTILANPGGPLPALPQLPRIQQALGPVLQHQNLLVVDPRGLGKSSPLLCPGLNLSEPDTIAACAAHLGSRARFFTADQAVRDMDAVRRTLGAGPVTFYGNSYGTAYAQAYAARHSESLAAAFLDSTSVTSADGYALWPCDPALTCSTWSATGRGPAAHCRVTRAAPTRGCWRSCASTPTPRCPSSRSGAWRG
ncbi:alpha/beta fold hydrolase [Nonomuraea sp. K274]|uniref:Alpha/beta fold hydrolase n=1 Tax=Nonomuraea cypriaca TaxID=1187855 RepID=A0A931EZP8_9ACTN|nr:alpha/beta fold hydrolase [Nonomuraea cypriaca]MBF8185438.1 alpha/beta fold hydrolase [Nonomuraea cypriaca]